MSQVSTRVVVFLVKGGKVLLGQRQRSSLGHMLWAGIGGKVEAGESIKEAAVREIKEEIGVNVNIKDLKERGEVFFEFPNKPKWSQKVTIFVTNKWQGELRETEEIKPAWFSISEMPFDNMWADNKFWVPLILEGKIIKAHFVYDKNNVDLKSFRVEIIKRKGQETISTL